MCDPVFLNYTQTLNNYDKDTALPPANPVYASYNDMFPTVNIFSDVNCGGSILGSNKGEFTFPSFDVTKPIPTQSIPANWSKGSFLIPFNMSVKFIDATNKYSSVFSGPHFQTDFSTLLWQGSTVYMVTPNEPTQFVITEYIPWDKTRFSMCTGSPEFIGVYHLTRFQSQSKACDIFMADWCKGRTSDDCACFSDLPIVEALSVKLKVNLPVTCFGTSCASKRSYKTTNMLSEPCNLTICSQIISTAGTGIIDNTKDQVFCGGQFFKENGQLNPVSNVSVQTQPSSATHTSEPFYVWIMLGVAGVFFITLVYLMFAPSKAKTGGLVRKLEVALARKKLNYTNRVSVN